MGPAGCLCLWESVAPCQEIHSARPPRKRIAAAASVLMKDQESEKERKERQKERDGEKMLMLSMKQMNE